jgi:hypothetical protein
MALSAKNFACGAQYKHSVPLWIRYCGTIAKTLINKILENSGIGGGRGGGGGIIIKFWSYIATVFISQPFLFDDAVVAKPLLVLLSVAVRRSKSRRLYRPHRGRYSSRQKKTLPLKHSMGKGYPHARHCTVVKFRAQTLLAYKVRICSVVAGICVKPRLHKVGYNAAIHVQE